MPASWTSLAKPHLEAWCGFHYATLQQVRRPLNAWQFDALELACKALTLNDDATAGKKLALTTSACLQSACVAA